MSVLKLLSCAALSADRPAVLRLAIRSVARPLIADELRLATWARVRVLTKDVVRFAI